VARKNFIAPEAETEAELALLLRACRDHEIASCEKCQKSYKLIELGSGPAVGLRFYLQDCPVILAERADAR
jgi:hypothetical protein